MVDYAIIPRRRSYWIEAVDEGGERRSIGTFTTEEAALRRLKELRGNQEAKERRRIAQETSRWYASQVIESGYVSRRNP